MKTFKNSKLLQCGAFTFIMSLCLFFFLNQIVLSAEKDSVSQTKGKWREYFFGRQGTKPVKEKGTKSSDLTDREELNPEGLIDLIDSPSTNVIDYGGYRLNFRLYSKGGLITNLSFGVFRRLNIGASWDNEEVVGSENPTTNAPTLNLKFRVYDGSEILPSFAIGYDGQGRFFNKTTDEYREHERGLFAVFGRELFFPKLESYGGANISKFKEGTVLGFVGLSYTIEQKLVLMTEYDNIRVGPENRWNAGLRFFPIPSLSIDFAFRKIASIEDKERIVRINYVGSF